jgi:hypothetical protein
VEACLLVRSGQETGLGPTTGLNVVVEKTRIPAPARSLNTVFVTVMSRTGSYSTVSPIFCASSVELPRVLWSVVLG